MTLTFHLTGPLRILDSTGAPVAGLSRRGQALLAYLACQPGMRAERGLLADLLWSDRAEEQARGSLRQELSALRRALPEGPILADRQAVWLAPGAVTVETTDAGEILQGFDLASEGFEDWLRAERARRAEATHAPPVAQTSSTPPTVAVLAFDEIGVARSDMFADGVVEEITGALSRVHEFHVIARQSAFALRGETLDAPAAAARLGADYLVEGSVRRAGDRVRIAVQLIAGSDGRTLWSERFDDRLDDLFDLQDRISAQVAGQVSPSLRTAEIARAGTRPPEDRTAYELTLTALPHFWAHRKEENALALRLLDEALAREPGYGPALAYKAWALAQQPAYMWSEDPLADHAAAAAAVEAAAPHAGDHPPSLVAVAAAKSMSTHDIEGAVALLDHALRLDPNNAWGWMRRGWAMFYSGDAPGVRAAMDRAEALSPLDPFRFNMTIGRALSYRLEGRSDIAARMVRAVIAGHPGLTWAYRLLVGDLALAGDTDAAAEAAQSLRRHYPHVTMRYLQACLPRVENEVTPDYLDAIKRAGILDA